jgi:hypothetical protein
MSISRTASEARIVQKAPRARRQARYAAGM